MCHNLTRKHNNDNNTGQFTVEFCWYQMIFSNILLSKSVVELSHFDSQKCPDFKKFWILFLSRQEEKLLLKYLNSYLKIGIYF